MVIRNNMSWQLENKLKILASEEIGAIAKDFGGKRTFVLIYPNTYHIGMSNLGVHNVYKLLNDRDDTVCERAFLPDDISEHKRTNTPVLSVESQRPITDFDTIAFSVAFENDIPNIKKILELSKGKFPKLIVGGAVATLNPKLFGEFFDEVITGNFECHSEGALATEESRRSRKSNASLDPSAASRPQDDTSLARSVIWTPNTEFGSMHLVEMQRGCPHHCKFCAAPVIYHPFRQFSKENIIKGINVGLPHRKKIGLIGGDVLAHPNFIEIAEYIHSCGAQFSPSSVRADRITDKIAELLAKSGHRTVTLAPETGSEGLRRKIGKNIPDEKFFQAAKILAEHGISQLKLYFMIGLPGETDADIEEIKNFVATFQRSNVSRVTVAINPFVPKRRTLFEAEPFAGTKTLKNKIAMLKNRLGKIGGIKLKFESPLSALKEYEMQSEHLC